MPSDRKLAQPLRKPCDPDADLRFDVSGLCRRTLVSPVPTSQMHRSGWANAAASLSSVFGLGFVD
jgi:hypothetical protein